MKDLVVGIDSSTQSTKAIAWTKTGELVAEGRSPIELHNPAFVLVRTKQPGLVGFVPDLPCSS